MIGKEKVSREKKHYLDEIITYANVMEVLCHTWNAP